MNSFLILSRLQSGTEEVVRLDEALAAIEAEREACAKVCEAGFGGDAALVGMRCAAKIRERSNAEITGSEAVRVD